MYAAIELDGLREFTRRAKALGEDDVLARLRAVLASAEQTAVARMQLRAAATGRRQDVAAAATLRGSKSKDSAIVRGGGARVPWTGGAAFGANRDQPRVGPSGRRYIGYRQFAPPRRESSWFLAGGQDAADAMRVDVEREVTNLLQTL